MHHWEIHPRISVNTVCSFNWSLEQDIDFYKDVGIGAITVSYLALAGDEKALIDRLLSAGIKCITMATSAGCLIESGEDTLKKLRGAIDAADMLGCPSVYAVSGPIPHLMTTDQAYDRFVETLQLVQAYAGSKGVRLGIEPTSVATRSHGFIHTLADAIDLSHAAGVGVCLELQNCWYERNLRQMFKGNANRFITVQVSDFKVGEEIRMNRSVPGDGSIPLEWMIGELLDAGYDGYFDLEILGPAIEAEGYPSAIRRGVDWLSTRLTQWGV